MRVLKKRIATADKGAEKLDVDVHAQTVGRLNTYLRSTSYVTNVVKGIIDRPKFRTRPFNESMNKAFHLVKLLNPFRKAVTLLFSPPAEPMISFPPPSHRSPTQPFRVRREMNGQPFFSPGKGWVSVIFYSPLVRPPGLFSWLPNPKIPLPRHFLLL